jgi:hypothetical protein
VYVSYGKRELLDAKQLGHSHRALRLRCSRYYHHESDVVGRQHLFLEVSLLAIDRTWRQGILTPSECSRSEHRLDLQLEYVPILNSFFGRSLPTHLLDSFSQQLTTKSSWKRDSIQAKCIHRAEAWEKQP